MAEKRFDSEEDAVDWADEFSSETGLDCRVVFVSDPVGDDDYWIVEPEEDE